MTPNLTVRPFRRESLSNQYTKMIIEIFPAPGESHIAHWYLDIPDVSEPDTIEIGEIEAVMDACFAAGEQMKRLIIMFDEQEEDDVE